MIFEFSLKIKIRNYIFHTIIAGGTKWGKRGVRNSSACVMFQSFQYINTCLHRYNFDDSVSQDNVDPAAVLLIHVYIHNGHDIIHLWILVHFVLQIYLKWKCQISFQIKMSHSEKVGWYWILWVCTKDLQIMLLLICLIFLCICSKCERKFKDFF
jgi:hypothetical protein